MNNKITDDDWKLFLFYFSLVAVLTILACAFAGE